MKLIVPNKCIYCFEAHDGTREHIVPEALNGRLILPRATCEECRKKINDRIESPLLSFHYKKMRRLGGFASKKRSRKNTDRPKRENDWKFILQRKSPPFQRTVPIKGSEILFSDVTYRYNLPNFLAHHHKGKGSRSALQVHHPMKLADLEAQRQALRNSDQDIVKIQTRTPIMRRDLLARLLCKISCGLHAGIFRVKSPELLRSFILEGGSDEVMNRFVQSADREYFPMKRGEARLFVVENDGIKTLYTALNILPDHITEVYFTRVIIPDGVATSETSIDFREPMDARSRLAELRLSVVSKEK